MTLEAGLGVRVSEKIDLLQRKLKRERAARKQAEMLLEQKAEELFESLQQLEASNRELGSIVRRLDRMTVEETTLGTLLKYALEPTDLEQFLQNALELILNSSPWLCLLPKGAMFVASGDSDSKSLEMIAEENLDAATRKHCRKLPFGTCHCGRAAQCKELVFSQCHAHHGQYVEPHAHFCVPIICNSQVAAVLTLYVPHDHELIDRDRVFLLRVADALSMGIVRRRVEEDLKKAKYEAEEAGRTKEEFLANMSHEFRTPLHGILSFAAFAKKEIDKGCYEKVPVFLDRITHFGDVLLELVTALLDLARLENNRADLDCRPHDLRRLVNIVVGEMESLGGERGIRVSAITPPQPAFALVDEGKIMQVIRNLLSNAIKFSPDDSMVEVDVVAEASVVRVAVKDRGVGIPPDELEVIFDKFSQSSRTHTGSGGTGLGLAISREILRTHRGTIHAENREGGGAIFVFELPACDGPDAVANHEEAACGVAVP